MSTLLRARREPASLSKKTLTALIIASALFLSQRGEILAACRHTWWDEPANCGAGDCPYICSVDCDPEPGSVHGVHIEECKSNRCYIDLYNCDTCDEARSLCTGGGAGFDEEPPECAETPLEFYAYGKSVTGLIQNPSFESVTEIDYNDDECSGACDTRSGDDCPLCPSLSGGSGRSPQVPTGWNTSIDTGARNEWPYSNDGPSDGTPPDNSGAPKTGSWQAGTVCGDDKDYATDHWTCRQKDERHGWHLSQLVSNLDTSSNYLLLTRTRGKCSSYSGCSEDACGWAETRARTVNSQNIRAGDTFHFSVNPRTDNNNGDIIEFNPTITLIDSSGNETVYNPIDQYSSVQGQNQWWYQVGTVDGGGSSGTRITSESNCIWENGLWRHPTRHRDAINRGQLIPCVMSDWQETWLKWVAPSDGLVTISGSVKALQDTSDGVLAKIYKNGEKIWEVTLEEEGETKDSHIVSGLLEFISTLTDPTGDGWLGGWSDDWWRGNAQVFQPNRPNAFLELKTKTSDVCSGWAPRGVADWLELIELCDTPDGCNHGTADGVVWSVSVDNGGRSEMQLSNDGGSTWGMISSSSDNSIVNSGWAPNSYLFYWGMNLSNPPSEVIIRFWNQRDEQQEVVECEGAPPPGFDDAKILGRVATPTTSPYDNYFRAGSCDGCAGECTVASGINITCNTAIATWGCNPDDAFYDTGWEFSQGQEVTCTLTNLPEGYRAVEWGYAAPGYTRTDCSGDGTSCSATITLDPTDDDGLHHLWFYLEPITAPTCGFTAWPTDCIEVDTNLSFTASASDDVGLDYLQLWQTPTTAPDGWEQLESDGDDESCSGVTSCGISRSWRPDTAGTYYVVCNAYDTEGAQCSGNPWCPCPGWADCGADDYLEITIQDSCAPPPATPPPCPPFFCKSFHTWKEIK